MFGEPNFTVPWMEKKAGINSKGVEMLLELEVKNWRSFQHLKFSTVATREQKHSYRVPKLEKYRIRVLPVTAIYGGNASGKTNMFKALAFMQRFVTAVNLQSQGIGIEPFALSREMREKPSEFKVNIFAEGTIYEYGFVASKKEVLQEWLIKVLPRREQVLFERKGDVFEFPTHFQERERFRGIAEGTTPHTLFLTNSVSQKGQEFFPIYRWFLGTLTLIAPDTRFGPYETFLDKTSPLLRSGKEFLQDFDTGICDLKGEDVSFENLPIDKNIFENLPSGAIARFDYLTDKYFVRRDDNGDITVKKLVTSHQTIDGDGVVNFGMGLESDGSRRLIDLYPMLEQLVTKTVPKVYMVDELDRSLHYLATRGFLERYLDSCDKETRSQLIFTTHDLLLMDQEFLRRDEMWITERKKNGSKIISLTEYQQRCDTDLVKSYLDGRFGGIPRVY